jgi:hypothetical protein
VKGIPFEDLVLILCESETDHAVLWLEDRHPKFSWKQRAVG